MRISIVLKTFFVIFAPCLLNCSNELHYVKSMSWTRRWDRHVKSRHLRTSSELDACGRKANELLHSQSYIRIALSIFPQNWYCCEEGTENLPTFLHILSRLSFDVFCKH